MNKTYKSHQLGATVDITKARIYFWGGIFSQWSKHYFEYKNEWYGCAEQAMMAQKALLFKDSETHEKILKDPNPRNQKAYGRQVKNYNDDDWSSVRYEIVKGISYAKFNQNPDIKGLILLTEGYMLVEASPYDKVWGIGLAENDPKIFDRDNWDGQNLLGKALMDARTRLIEEL